MPGDVAVALYNKGSDSVPAQPPIPPPPCNKWTATKNGYYEATGGAAGNVGSFSGLSVEAAEAACCKNPKCAGFSFKDGSGYYKGNALAGFVNDAGYQGYYKPNQIVKPKPPSQDAADITVDFAMLDLHGSVTVYDIWQNKVVGSFQDKYTATEVPFHGSAFLRLSSAAGSKLFSKQL